MSKWRRLAIEMFPEQRQEFQQSETTYYQVFFDLRWMVKEYHEIDNVDGLRNIYSFAEWCWLQLHRAPDLANAAAVAFYEHLIDDPVVYEAIPYWVKPSIFEDMMGLLQWRLEKRPEEFEALVKRYNKINGTNFALPKSEVILDKPKSKPKRKARDGRIYQSGTRRP